MKLILFSSDESSNKNDHHDFVYLSAISESLEYFSSL